MMKFIQTHSTGSDCTAPYDIILDHKYTFGELVDEILAKGEWGSIKVESIRFEYQNSKCGEYPESLRQYIVKEVKSAGGYSNMDYYVKLENKKATEEFDQFRLVVGIQIRHINGAVVKDEDYAYVSKHIRIDQAKEYKKLIQKLLYEI